MHIIEELRVAGAFIKLISKYIYIHIIEDGTPSRFCGYLKKKNNSLILRYLKKTLVK